METEKELNIMSSEDMKELYIIEIQNKYRVDGLIMNVVFTLPYFQSGENKKKYFDFLCTALSKSYSIVRCDKIPIIFAEQESEITKRYCGWGKETLIISIVDPYKFIQSGDKTWDQYIITLDVFYIAHTQMARQLVKNLCAFIPYFCENGHRVFINEIQKAIGNIKVPQK